MPFKPPRTASQHGRGETNINCGLGYYCGAWYQKFVRSYGREKKNLVYV